MNTRKSALPAKSLRGSNAMREHKLGILIPTYNSGSLLAESVNSAAKARLPPDTYEIVVSDNASTDGSTEGLPTRDAQGAPVTLHRNAENIGRVENWNRILELVEEMGFAHIIFLMAGDLIRGDDIVALRERMIRADAALGFASYEIIGEDRKPRRVARRLIWPEDEAISAQRFLAQTLSAGAAIFGPLGANIYNLHAARLRFDPTDATHTDQYATSVFLRMADRPVVYLDRPITQWRERADRFHSSMDFLQRLENDLALIERVANETGVEIDHRKILSTFLLRIVFHARGNPLKARSYWNSFLCKSKPISPPWMVRLLSRQILYKTPWRIAI